MKSVTEEVIKTTKKVLNVGTFLTERPHVRIVGEASSYSFPRGPLVRIAFGHNASLDLDEIADTDELSMAFGADELDILAAEFIEIAKYLREKKNGRN